MLGARRAASIVTCPEAIAPVLQRIACKTRLQMLQTALGASVSLDTSDRPKRPGVGERGEEAAASARIALPPAKREAVAILVAERGLSIAEPVGSFVLTGGA